ncbi:type II toxin-antitoxin system VapC family toxin [Agrobacterium sp. a22-2]|uniref:type II toxin-antitoxin system VapC family toxin n=1 Tax=Agrobacterium sp. a22-2 TaxID=2283840 RepID=UPI001444F1C5|nr:type II toxin-antitoxin system VapC family toxin [Agrobacterium sp. a22-2]NKN39664.1 type II toxin-antitoxin system VapC family toxin [Agrobacterium sp. a22-2]
MFLLDTNVVSELRKAKSGRCDANVLRWSGTVLDTELFISVITLFEIEKGIRLLNLRDHLQAQRLRHWLNENVLTTFATNLLPVDKVIALAAAPLHVPDPRPDRDAFIAATALVHGLTVVTRNTADFRDMNLALINPWEGQGIK